MHKFFLATLAALLLGTGIQSQAAEKAPFVPPTTAEITAAKSAMKNVQVGELTMYYTEQGQGDPVLLIHGGSLTHAMWQGLADALAPRYRVIMPDSRGHGFTDNPSGQFSYRIMAEDMVAFAKALNVEKPLVMGYSDGGMISLMLGVYHPDFAKAIIVGGASLSLGDAKYMEGMKAFGSDKAGVLSREELEAASAQQPWMREVLGTMHHPDTPDYWKEFLIQVWPMWTTPVEISDADLQKFTTPAMLLIGDRDEYFGINGVVKLYQTLPNAELAVIPYGVHSSMRLRADLFNALVSDFFDRQQKTQAKKLSNAEKALGL